MNKIKLKIKKLKIFDNIPNRYELDKILFKKDSFFKCMKDHRISKFLLNKNKKVK